MSKDPIMKNVLLTCCGLLTIPGVWVCAVAADEPVNLAPKAEVWASSQYNDSWAAKYAIDGKTPKWVLATRRRYRVAAAFTLGQIGNHEAVPALLETVNNFDNVLEVRHAAARALAKLCDSRDLEVLRTAAEDYPEVHTRRVLLNACEEAERRR